MEAGRRDAGLAAGVALVQVVGTAVAASHQDDARPLNALALALLVVGPGALAVARGRPEVPLFVSVVALQAYLALDFVLGPVFVAFAVSVVLGVLSRRRAAVGLAVGVFLVGLGAARASGEIGWGAVTGGAAWTLTLVSLSEVVRSRLDGAAQARRAAEQEALRRAGEERLVIARELHDVLAHSLSLISVRAGVGLHLFDDQPQEARESLRAIKDASGDGLRDLRRTLDVLREKPSTAPAPGLADLDRLLDASRAAGLAVECHVEGRPRLLAVPADLAAYRLVQEALTNVTRHSASTTARVLLTWDADGVDVQVEDDGPARSSQSEDGHGLSGMRERVGALGGTVASGRTSDGGFCVRARLPG